MNRKEYPIFRGLFKYFPKALMEVSHVSYVGNEKHNPGEPMHWAREKSTDDADALLRHLLNHASGERLDDDGLSHLSKVAWRSLALLEKELELFDGLETRGLTTNEEADAIIKQMQKISRDIDRISSTKIELVK